VNLGKVYYYVCIANYLHFLLPFSLDRFDGL